MADSGSVLHSRSGTFVDPGEEAAAEAAAVYGLRGRRGWFGWIGVAGHPANDKAVYVQDGGATGIGFGIRRVAIGIVGMDPADVFAATILEPDDVEDFRAR